MNKLSSSVQQQPRKRKIGAVSSLSNHFNGSLTRSRSQIYVHCTRSGRKRSDSLPSKPIRLRSETESVEAFSKMNSSKASWMSSVKDLRSQRVFTPDVNSILVEKNDGDLNEGMELPKGSDAGSTDLDEVKLDKAKLSEEIILNKEEYRPNYDIKASDLKDQVISGKGSISQTQMVVSSCRRRKVFKASSSFSYRRLLPYLMDIAQHDCSDPHIETVGAGTPSKLPKLGAVNSETLSVGEDSYATTVEHATSGPFHTNLSGDEGIHKWHENDPNRVSSALKEECGQMTPPDPDILAKMEAGDCRESMDNNNILANSQIFKDLSVGGEKSTHNLFQRSSDGKHGSKFTHKSVFKPCSRMRVFKNPRSLSYRRLLPILMDISKYNSCVPGLSQYQKPVLDFSEDLQPPTPVNAGEKHVEERQACNSYEKEQDEEQGHNLPSDVVQLPDASSPYADNVSGSSMLLTSSINLSSELNPSPITAENHPDQHLPTGLLEKGKFLTEGSSTRLETDLYLKDVKPIVRVVKNAALQPSSTVNDLCKSTTSEEPGKDDTLKCLNIAAVHNIGGEPVENVYFNQSSFQIEVSEAFVAPSYEPPKGILKRNPRGCRGPCNCLNCASFRLHAIKAFEFSRNQMHDAEEVVSELMGELAKLRDLFEKSIVRDDDLAITRLNPIQVKEACSKALETENQAKERLSQLNYDLNVHCRIPALLQPKVTFANHIEERAIPMLDPSISSAVKRS